MKDTNFKELKRCLLDRKFIEEKNDTKYFVFRPPEIGIKIHKLNLSEARIVSKTQSDYSENFRFRVFLLESP